MPSRRVFLATGAFIALSGCPALDSASARIARIRLVNADSTAQEFALAVSIDGETVYDETHLIGAEENESTVELTEEIPDERGEVTIETELHSPEITESTTFDDNRCYDVIAEYTGDNLIHWQSGSSDGCDVFTGE